MKTQKRKLRTMKNSETVSKENYKIIKGKPTEIDLEIVHDLILKGYIYGLNIPHGIEWHREGDSLLTRNLKLL